MKILVICFLSFFGFSALSQDRMGGQEGNGGTGCWYENEYGVVSWKTIEELKYNHILGPEQNRYSAQNPNVGTITLRIRPAGSLYQENFLDTLPARLAILRLQQIAFRFPNVYKTLISYTGHLKNVTVVQVDYRGKYRGKASQSFSHCLNFSPAMLTVNDGTVFAFRPVWNSITALTSEIVLLHEIIRFTQLFHPSFHDLSDEELQKLSALLFSVHNESAELEKILRTYEVRLTW